MTTTSVTVVTTTSVCDKCGRTVQWENSNKPKDLGTSLFWYRPEGNEQYHLCPWCTKLLDEFFAK